MKPITLKRERGAALLALLAVIMLVASWFLVSKLNSESGGIAAANRARNAEVLNRAKQALIGYVAMQALNSDEDNPGRLPCPEHAWYVGNSDKEGVAGPSVGVSSPGSGTSDCSSAGRLPWRTLGLEKLLDTAGEPLWYVVRPTWRLTTSTSTLLINSNTTGDIAVDGQQVVALIIAPGAAMNVQAATGCTALNQTRSAPSPTMIAANYIECFNPDFSQFVTVAPSASYNDQAIRITVADIMPGIEAAIARRIERDIVPVLKTVYTSTEWGSGISMTNPMFPFAAPWSTSTYGPGPGTVAAPSSDYKGVAGTYQGLFPFNLTVGCTTSAADPRCNTSLHTFSKGGSDTKISGDGSVRTDSTCTWVATVYVCTGEYNEQSIALRFRLSISNVAMGLRTLDLTKVTCSAVDDVGAGSGLQSVACTATAAMQTNGSLLITVTTSALPGVDAMGWGSYANYRINIDRTVIGDHAMLDTTVSTRAWFWRNEWYRLLYYASAPTHTAEQATPSCTNNCLTVTNMTPSDNKRALLILAGRSPTGAARPNGTLSDYLEFANADLNTVFEKQPISNAKNAAAKAPFNDRVIVLDSN